MEKMQRQRIQRGKRWYVIHTYSGYEDAVAHNLRQRIDSMGMQDKIFEVLVPKEKKIRFRNGKRQVIEEKIYPGYVLVEMVVDDDSWYVVRNTPRVTGFVGSGTTPIPVTEDDIQGLQKQLNVDEPRHKIDVVVGDSVKIGDGPFKDFDGKVSEIDENKGKVHVLVSMFGRETPVELDYLQIIKV